MNSWWPHSWYRQTRVDQSKHWPDVCEVTLKEMGKIAEYQSTTRRNSLNNVHNSWDVLHAYWYWSKEVNFIATWLRGLNFCVTSRKEVDLIVTSLKIYEETSVKFIVWNKGQENRERLFEQTASIISQPLLMMITAKFDIRISNWKVHQSGKLYFNSWASLVVVYCCGDINDVSLVKKESPSPFLISRAWGQLRYLLWNCQMNGTGPYWW